MLRHEAGIVVDPRPPADVLPGLGSRLGPSSSSAGPADFESEGSGLPPVFEVGGSMDDVQFTR
jgi:hypothetical protein